MLQLLAVTSFGCSQVFQSLAAHKRLLKKAEFDIAPPRFWMRVLDVGTLQSHLLAEQFQFLGNEIDRGMGVGKKLVY